MTDPIPVTSEGITELLSEATRTSKKAYARYSGFKVGAAVRTNKGNVYLGCNVENVSYSITTCAERNALAAAIAAEGPDVEIVAIAISALNNGSPAPCAPCGACRQAISENAPKAEVVFHGAGMKLKRHSPAELLPGAFDFELQEG